MTLKDKALISSLLLIFPVITVSAQNIYELRKYSENDWVSMSTQDRLNTLGLSLKQSQNQTFIGDFGIYYDLNAYKVSSAKVNV